MRNKWNKLALIVKELIFGIIVFDIMLEFIILLFTILLHLNKSFLSDAGIVNTSIVK